jgi:hypothetical protein
MSEYERGRRDGLEQAAQCVEKRAARDWKIWSGVYLESINHAKAIRALTATSGMPAPQDDPMSADWRAGYEKAKTTFYSQGFTDGAQHEESRLRAVRNDVADSLGDVLALFDDNGELREEYQDQASVTIERAEANLKSLVRAATSGTPVEHDPARAPHNKFPSLWCDACPRPTSGKPATTPTPRDPMSWPIFKCPRCNLEQLLIGYGFAQAAAPATTPTLSRHNSHYAAHMLGKYDSHYNEINPIHTLVRETVRDAAIRVSERMENDGYLIDSIMDEFERILMRLYSVTPIAPSNICRCGHTLEEHKGTAFLPCSVLTLNGFTCPCVDFMRHEPSHPLQDKPPAAPFKGGDTVLVQATFVRELYGDLAQVQIVDDDSDNDKRVYPVMPKCLIVATQDKPTP